MKIIMSRISEETSIAEILKDWIESTFLGQCEVFASSGKVDLPAGNKWISEIDQAFDSAVVFLAPLAQLHLRDLGSMFKLDGGGLRGFLLFRFVIQH